MFMKHSSTKKARIIGSIANHPGPMQSASSYRHASRHCLIFSSKRASVYSLSNFALPAAPMRFRNASSSSSQPIRSASGSTSRQGTRKPVSPSSGKNGVDCYSKNGHAVTVLTRQSYCFFLGSTVISVN